MTDRYLPVFQFRERHGREIMAPPKQVMAAVQCYRPERDAFFRRMIALRELPVRLLPGGRMLHEPFGLGNFTLLETDADTAMAYGLIGRFWQFDYGLRPCPDGNAFRTFAEPGTARLLLTFTTQPVEENRTRLWTETRVHCPDRASLLRFAPYWYLIRPVSGLIRQRMLAGIGRDAV